MCLETLTLHGGIGARSLASDVGFGFVIIGQRTGPYHTDPFMKLETEHKIFSSIHKYHITKLRDTIRINVSSVIIDMLYKSYFVNFIAFYSLVFRKFHKLDARAIIKHH